MAENTKRYLLLVGIHTLIGFVVFLLPFLSQIYFILIFVIGFIYVFRTQNQDNQVLEVASYIVGCEVFLRMTNASPSYEIGKYGVMIFMFIGLVYSGISKRAIIYWIYLLLLIPGLILGALVLSNDIGVRKLLIFNISGPISLGLSAIYCLDRKITIKKISNLLMVMGLPIISCATYVFFYSPKIKDVLIGTGSNNDLSGGFGANQVATIFGLGTFIFVNRLIFDSKTKIIIVLNIAITSYIAFRGFLTFSRGGMVTGFLMIAFLLVYVYIMSSNRLKSKLKYLIISLITIIASIWLIASFETSGLIDKRYSNQDKYGKSKEDISTGRADLASLELELFYDNIFFGIGVGKGSDYRKEKFGIETASHDEITRTLAEHGFLGIIILLILIITPIILFFKNLNHIYFFPFFIFWFFTINHAAMRTASAALIYGFALLKVRKNDED